MFPRFKGVKAQKFDRSPSNLPECCDHAEHAKMMTPPHPTRLLPEPAKGRAFRPTPAKIRKPSRY